MKRTRSSTKSVKATLAPRLSPIIASMSQETLDHMKNCEAREWLKRRKEKIGALGLENAQYWWGGVKNDIKRIRGDKGLADLIRRMETERNDAKASVSAKRVDAQQQKRQALGNDTQGQDAVQGGLFLPDQG
jgi:hypothetical protein